MPIESDADRLAFLDEDEFAVEVTVTATSATFSAIFDKPYLAVSGAMVDLDADAPELVCRSSDVTSNSLAEGVALTIQGSSYVVVSVRPDGTGMTRVVLHDG